MTLVEGKQSKINVISGHPTKQKINFHFVSGEPNGRNLTLTIEEK
jgi:hypothetical protein